MQELVLHCTGTRVGELKTSTCPLRPVQVLHSATSYVTCPPKWDIMLPPPPVKEKVLATLKLSTLLLQTDGGIPSCPTWDRVSQTWQILGFYFALPRHLPYLLVVPDPPPPPTHPHANLPSPFTYFLLEGVHQYVLIQGLPKTCYGYAASSPPQLHIL